MKFALFCSLLVISVFFLAGCFGVTQKDATAEYDSQYMKNSQVTSDIQFIGTAKGSGTRNELFGLIKWGDRGRASYEGQDNDFSIDDQMTLESKQSAVYNALDGKPENFLIDPRFHTKTKNFLIFKSYETEVVGQQASKSNYRQVKRFSTDGTETVELDRLPHTYTINRNGRVATQVVTSGNIPSHVTNSIKVYETTPGVEVLSIGTPSNHVESDSLIGSLNAFEEKMKILNRKIEALSR
ncbi:MAG: hypothetical protein HN553_10405 [Opitutae bacterium]|nr:hypothetical protein [Opitutae bacterium]